MFDFLENGWAVCHEIGIDGALPSFLPENEVWSRVIMRDLWEISLLTVNLGLRASSPNTLMSKYLGQYPADFLQTAAKTCALSSFTIRHAIDMGDTYSRRREKR